MSKFREIYKSDVSSEPMSKKIYEKTLKSMRNSELPEIHIKNSRRYRWGAIVPIAASLLITATIAAAVLVPRFIKPSERGGYDGHIYSQNTDGPVEKNIPEELWSSIGMEVNQSVSNNNLTITVKDIAYDNSLMYINIDVRTNDGSPLQENSINSKSLLYGQTFKTMYIECDGQKISLNAFRIDSANEPDKASFECFTDTAGLLGKNIKLILSDLQDTVEHSADIGFLFDNLADACETLTPVNDTEFINIGTLISYTNGKKAYVYTIPAGNKKVYFSGQYPGAYIDNYGFHTVGEATSKGLYLSILPGSRENAASLLSNGLAFKNIVTGEIITSSYPTTAENADFSVNKGRIILTIESWTDFYYGLTRFDDFNEFDLANYILVSNPATETFTRESGTWIFEFKVDSVARTETFIVNKTIDTNWGEMTIDSIAISPLSLYIKGSISDWNGDIVVIANTHFTMKDGSIWLATRKGAAGEIGSTIDLQFSLDKPINVDDIQSVNFLGTDFQLRQEAE